LREKYRQDIFDLLDDDEGKKQPPPPLVTTGTYYCELCGREITFHKHWERDLHITRMHYNKMVIDAVHKYLLPLKDETGTKFG
jgi:hypothetical protein